MSQSDLTLVEVMRSGWKFVRMADDLHRVVGYINDMRVCLIALTIGAYLGGILLFVYYFCCIRGRRKARQASCPNCGGGGGGYGPPVIVRTSPFAGGGDKLDGSDGDVEQQQQLQPRPTEKMNGYGGTAGGYHRYRDRTSTSVGGIPAPVLPTRQQAQQIIGGRFVSPERDSLLKVNPVDNSESSLAPTGKYGRSMPPRRTASTVVQNSRWLPALAKAGSVESTNAAVGGNAVESV